MGKTNDTPIFIPYKANEAFANQYYQVPVELFINPLYKDKLNSDSKLLYALLINRLNLSIANNWVDEDGNIYLIFSRKEAEEALGLSNKTTVKAFKILNDLKLISERRQGKTKNNLIFVGKINNAKVTKVKCNNYTSRSVESTSHEVYNLHPYNKYKNNNYYNKYNKGYRENLQKFYDPNDQYSDETGLYANIPDYKPDYKKKRFDNRYFNPDNEIIDCSKYYANFDNKYFEPNKEPIDYNKYVYNNDKEKVSNRFFDPNDEQYSTENLKKLGIIV